MVMKLCKWFSFPCFYFCHIANALCLYFVQYSSLADIGFESEAGLRPSSDFYGWETSYRWGTFWEAIFETVDVVETCH